MVRMKMAQTIKDAVKFIQQGHVRVGVELVKDPAFLVSRYYLSISFYSVTLLSSSYLLF